MDLAKFQQNVTIQSADYDKGAYNTSSTKKALDKAMNWTLTNAAISKNLDGNATQAFKLADKEHNQMKRFKKEVEALYQSTREIKEQGDALKKKVAELSNETKAMLPGIDTVQRRM